MPAIIGWDIGGAQVKAARAEDGAIIAVAQIACDSHQGLAHLERAIAAAAAQLGAADQHRVTMTAELSDAFENRMRGVVSIAAIIARELPSDALRFYAGARGFVTQDNVEAQACHIASANWRASAELVAQHCAAALFVDFGSTTTDLVPIHNGRVIAQGASDAERLQCGELVYAGFTRGAPQAYVRYAPNDGVWTPLVNESFATMADVRRVLGDLAEGETQADLSPTVDGRPKTGAASRARLARLAGCDDSAWSAAQASAFAEYLARAQWRVIEDQIALLASRGAVARDALIVGAGVGRVLVARWASAQGRGYRDFADLVAAPEALKKRAAECAPAAALALLKNAGV